MKLLLGFYWDGQGRFTQITFLRLVSMCNLGRFQSTEQHFFQGSEAVMCFLCWPHFEQDARTMGTSLHYFLTTQNLVAGLVHICSI